MFVDARSIGQNRRHLSGQKSDTPGREAFSHADDHLVVWIREGLVDDRHRSVCLSLSDRPSSRSSRGWNGPTGSSQPWPAGCSGDRSGANLLIGLSQFGDNKLKLCSVTGVDLVHAGSQDWTCRECHFSQHGIVRIARYRSRRGRVKETAVPHHVTDWGEPPVGQRIVEMMVVRPWRIVECGRTQTPVSGSELHRARLFCLLP